MGIRIDDPDLEASVRRLAALTKVDVMKAIATAVERDLARNERALRGRLKRMRAIADRAATLELRDRRSDDDIIGYDEHGLPS